MDKELILGVIWVRIWVRQQMIYFNERLGEMGGRLRNQSINQWYFQVCQRTFLIQLKRKEQVMSLFELENREWKPFCELDSFFSFEVWL
jgi:hypothetical protein